MKHLSIVRYALLAISAIIMIVWLFFQELNNVDTMLYWTYLIFAVAIALIIIMPMINMFKNPKGAMRSLIGLAAIVILGIAFYAMGSAEAIPKSAGGSFDDPTILKLSDVGLYLTYVALGLTILVAVYSEIRNAFK